MAAAAGADPPPAQSPKAVLPALVSISTRALPTVRGSLTSPLRRAGAGADGGGPVAPSLIPKDSVVYSGGIVACTVLKGSKGGAANKKVKAFRVHFGAARGQSAEVAKAVAKSLRRVHAEKLAATKTMKTERLDQWSKDLRGSSSRIQTLFLVRRFFGW